jgi:hypothetical protein
MGIDKSRKDSKKGSGRDCGGFVALPWSVLDCPAYSLLSHPAKSLLIEFSRQYVRDNNGRLLASGRYLSKRGWKSADVIQRAKRELIDAGFIYETVKGHRPNKASWYAITWQNLDKHSGYDAGTFDGWKDVRSGYANSKYQKIKSLIPSQGVRGSVIAPSGGVKVYPPIPSSEAINALFVPLPTPSGGNHLDIPSNKGISNVIPR